jgi:hypothetical protein
MLLIFPTCLTQEGHRGDGKGARDRRQTNRADGTQGDSIFTENIAISFYRLTTIANLDVPAVEVEGMPSLNQMLEVARKLRMEKEREKELQVRLVITVSTLIKRK